MSSFLALFNSGSHLLTGAGVVIVALIVSWFGGKKIGKVQEKGRADVAAAKVEADRVAVVANKQAKTIEEVKDVQAANNALADDDARRKLHESSSNGDS